MKRLKISIANGNSKLGAVPNISLPPIKACGNCSGCKKDCYALKAWRQYRETRAAWTRNYTLAMRDRSDYFIQLDQFLARRKPRFFRWHVSGDILDQEYLLGMGAIAIKHPNTNFLCFTKMYSLDFRDIPDNLTIVFSAWPNLPMPRHGMSVAYMQDGTETRVPNDVKECPGNCETCGMCFSLKRNESVVFYKH